MTIQQFFFGDILTWYVCLFRIFLSFLAGFILGVERKSRQQFVGTRTLILICVSSTILMFLSIYIPKTFGNGSGDYSRIAAQVVSGIGFLGGGTIIRQGMNIKGLTSSAIIWAAAALGLAIGAGLLIPAGIGLVVFVVSLIFLERFEMKFFPAAQAKKLYLLFENNKIKMQELETVLASHGLLIVNKDVTRIINQKQLSITFSIRVPREFDVLSLCDAIKPIGHLEEFSLTD